MKAMTATIAVLLATASTARADDEIQIYNAGLSRRSHSKPRAQWHA